VPTAIPGRSLHEIGLAVDITSGGRTITGSSPAFRWLAANAGKYGYVNLPSEPWHWSITGG
jgi:D-alanyl-D-alanine carboxypeptidase